MRIETESLENDRAIVAHILCQQLDAGNVKSYKEQIQPCLEANQAVLLDMSQLEFVDSSGLGALLSCLRTMNNKSGQLKLYAMAPPVQALFELVRMHRIFAIYNSRAEAEAAL